MIISNVVEKCLIKGTPGHIEIICTELFHPNILQEMATDRFSNFVVQRALEVSKGQAQGILFKKIYEISHVLRGFKYGKFVLNSIEKLKKKN